MEKRNRNANTQSKIEITMGYFEGIATSSIIAPVLGDDLKNYYAKKGFFNVPLEEVMHLDRFFERTENGRPFISGSSIIGMLNRYTKMTGEREVWDRIKRRVHILRMEGEVCVVEKRFVGNSLVVYECFPASTRLFIYYLDFGLSKEDRETLKALISKAGTILGVGAWLRRGFGRFKLL